ncbi:MAG: Hsp33 family molecular chaperone HslO [Shewanellaceae bacterium]|nr:Hsp33 family molecular chaperone HslO [Shewanellaceae bacterium]
MQKDHIYRYLFQESDIRGEMVQLNHTLKNCLVHRSYPPVITALLGELLSMTSLLTATLKFEGEITLQLQSQHAVELAVVTGTHQNAMRGLIQFDEAKLDKATSKELTELCYQGTMVITISPTQGQRYQGIIQIEQPTLAGCVEQYFLQSEQLQTRIWLYQQGDQAGGIMLQALPSEHKEAQQHTFEHLSILTETLKEQELFDLDAQQILHRLYHEEDVLLFEPDLIHFKCTCSQTRSAQAIISLGQSEVERILAEETTVNLDCEFCGKVYDFDAVDVAKLFHTTPTSKK